MESHIPGPGRFGETFVGRRAEVRTLLAEADLARAGHPRVVLLTGEPGIGKTALVRQFIREAEGFHLLQASGEEAEALLEYVDEVELDGDPPTIVRRPGSDVAESPHAHPHTSIHGAAPAPVGSAHEQGGT